MQNSTIPAQTLASADLAQAGAMEGIPSSESFGLGRQGGAGTGVGTGIGPGQGSGLGPGTGGGTGGGAYRPGNGVETPRLLREVKPKYTAPAMRAKIQGEVLLECVVQPDGTVGNIRVVRSLDPTFGLDQEAIVAARQWRFAPGTRKGEPVPVLVTIAIAFTLRWHAALESREQRAGSKTKGPRGSLLPGLFSYCYSSIDQLSIEIARFSTSHPCRRRGRRALPLLSSLQEVRRREPRL